MKTIVILLLAATTTLAPQGLSGAQTPAAPPVPPRAAAAPAEIPLEARPTPLPGAIRKPEPNETLQSVRARIEARMAKVQTFTCQVEMSKKREKREGQSWRKIRSGPLELARGVGGRVMLTRKGETEEYIANRQVIWSYDHKAREAQFIPTGAPVVGTFVQEAMRLNVFLAADEDTLKLRAVQEFDGEDCWVIEGLSPSRLKPLGIEPTKIRVWVAKKDCLPRKIQVPKEHDLTIVLRDFQVNAPVDPSRFQFAPPAGVKTKNIFGF